SSRRRHTRCYRDWSSDVCSSDLSPADVYLEKKEAQDKAAAKQAADSQQPAAAKPVSPSPAPLLSNPKTLEDADRMIAWEKRDIEIGRASCRERVEMRGGKE